MGSTLPQTSIPTVDLPYRNLVEKHVLDGVGTAPGNFNHDSTENAQAFLKQMSSFFATIALALVERIEELYIIGS